MLNVSACASLQELEALRGEWDALLSRAISGTIFAAWEFADAFWRHSLPGKEPLVLLARNSQGKLVGVLPLALTRRVKGLMPAVEVLGSNALGYPIGDYWGLLAEPGAEVAVWAAFVRHLKKRRWTMIDLRNCMTTTPGKEESMAHLFERPLNGLGWGVRVATSDVCRRIHLPATFDDYLATLSSNGRQNLRRKMRKLTEAGLTIGTVDLSDETAREVAMQALITYHQARWGGTESTGGFPDERSKKMHRHLVAQLAPSGRVELRAVRTAEGEIVGVIYNLRQNGVGYFYGIGFSGDEKWSQLSLGVCLLADSIAAAIEEGCHTFDLLRGDHDYKRHFGGYEAYNQRITIYRYAWLPRLEAVARKLKSRGPAGALSVEV